MDSGVTECIEFQMMRREFMPLLAVFEGRIRRKNWKEMREPNEGKKNDDIEFLFPKQKIFHKHAGVWSFILEELKLCV